MWGRDDRRVSGPPGKLPHGEAVRATFEAKLVGIDAELENAALLWITRPAELRRGVDMWLTKGLEAAIELGRAILASPIA